MLKRLVVSAVLLPVAARAEPVTFGAHVPALGCFATEPARHLAACVIGGQATNMGLPTSAVLVFAPLAAGAKAPDAIPLYEKEDSMSGLEQQPLEGPIRAHANAALAGFVPIAPPTTIAVGGVLATKDLRIVQRRTSEGGENDPPRFDTRLEHRRGTGWEIVDRQAHVPTSRYVVRLYAGGLVERLHAMAEEGSYGSSVDVWLCRKACVTIDR